MMSLYSFSQRDSTIRKVVIGKDTGAFVPTYKVRKINKLFIDLDECKETKDTLNQIIKKYDIAYTKLDSSLQFKKMEVIKKDSIIMSYENITKKNELLLDRKEWNIKLLKAQRNILIPLAGILLVIILVP